jgi:ferredoxin-NADP reductase
MALPDLPPEKRDEVQRAASERMQSGTTLLRDGLDQLLRAASTDDSITMQDAIAKLREGLARFDSGLAAHRTIADGKPPRDVALQWFKREMHLAAPAGAHRTTGPLGLSWFHIWVMLLLLVFAGTMLWIYFLKMRRASRLLLALTGGAPSPVPTAVTNVSAGPVRSDLAASPADVPVCSTKWSFPLRIGRIFQETPDVKTFRLMNPLGGVLPFSYLPGQFLTVAVPVDGTPVKRSYSIASSPTRHDYAEITVKHEEGGVVSSFLHARVTVGYLVECSGPAGTFIFTGRECTCILLIAGGVGITPLMSVLRYLLDRSWSGDIFLLYGCRTPQDIIFREELEYLQRRHPNLRVVVTVSHPEGTDWQGPTGRITKELLAAFGPDLPSRYVHICGPVPMMEAVKQMLAELGMPRERIKTEAFGPALGKAERTPSAAAAPADRGTQGDAAAVALPTVTFSLSDKSASLPPDTVILEVAEEIGVDIDYSCRVGICGVCRIQLISGHVTMAVEEGLQPGDKEKGMILACQAKAEENVTVEA